MPIPLYFHVPEINIMEETMFTAWMNLNKITPVARRSTYSEIPGRFTWNRKVRKWQARRRGVEVGVLKEVPREMGELYFLRMLLSMVRGPTCDEDIRTYEGVVYDTYREACYAHGVLRD